MYLPKLLCTGSSLKLEFFFPAAANGCHREEQKGLLDMLLSKRPGNIFWLCKDCFTEQFSPLSAENKTYFTKLN